MTIKELHECKAQPAQQDIPDLIAGALGVSRGTAYDMMREALKDASPVQEQVAAELERIAQEPPVNGNNLAQARVLMAAQRIRNTTPTAQPTQQEPVGEVMLERMGIDDAQVVRFQMYKEIPPVGTKLYTSPPAQRTWVGLTLSDREKLRDQFEGWSYPAILVDAVSDILKERNQ